MKKTVLSGFGLLCRLNLYGKPQGATPEEGRAARQDEADVWTWALIEAGEVEGREIDGPRVMKGFARLLGSRGLTRWPLPADLLKLLPERPKPQTGQPGRGPELLPLTPQEVIEGRQRWRELMAKICGPGDVRSEAEESRREAAHRRERMR